MPDEIEEQRLAVEQVLDIDQRCLDAALVDQLLAGAKGLVIAVAGADLTGGSLAPGINYAQRRGVIVVAATRTGSGRIAALSAARVREGIIGGEDLTPLKARILLMLALTKTQSAADVQRMFTEY